MIPKKCVITKPVAAKSVPFVVKYSYEQSVEMLTGFNAKERAKRGTTKIVLELEAENSSSVRDAHIKRQSCPCVLTEYHSRKAYRGSGGIAPLIL
jgi:hypothetical protein